MPPHQTLPALLCVALLGCAVGVEDWEAPADPVIGAPTVDAGAGFPPAHPGFDPGSGSPPTVITYDSGGAVTSDARVEVVVVDSGTGGSPGGNSGSGQGATTGDSAVGQPSTPRPTTDAGTASADAGSATDSGSSPSTSSDAGVAPKPVDAGYTPPEAGPMCQAATCTNYCGLARRCCNASNQCACMSLFGNCTLPSLRP